MTPDPHSGRMSGPAKPAELLLTHAMRLWARMRDEGERPHDIVAKALTFRVSPRVGALFLAWIQAVEADCIRPIQIECPRCGGLSLDEQRLIVACGLAPVDQALAEALLAPLLTDPRPAALMGRALNAALSREGWPLPVRIAAPAAETRPTLH